MYKLLLLAFAGAVGTLARYSLAGVVQRVLGPDFPWGTLVVNTAGCLAAGFFWALFEGRLAVTSIARVVVLVGFMGGFTTFSTYILETGQLIRDSQLMMAMMNLMAQNVIGIICLFIGMALGRLI